MILNIFDGLYATLLYNLSAYTYLYNLDNVINLSTNLYMHLNHTLKLIQSSHTSSYHSQHINTNPHYFYHKIYHISLNAATMVENSLVFSFQAHARNICCKNIMTNCTYLNKIR